MKHEIVLDRFREQASRHPEKIAVQLNASTITYRELEAKSDNVSSFLARLDVPKGGIVAILADEAALIIPAIIGVLKAGCVFMPLDPAVPEARLHSMIAQACPVCCLYQPEWESMAISLSDIRSHQLARLDHSGIWLTHGSARGTSDCMGVSFSEKAQSLSVTYNADDMAYIYFTSGSTGIPKAIAGRLGSIGQYINWEVNTFGIQSDNRTSQLTNHIFDAYLRDIFIPLSSGGTICIPPARTSDIAPDDLIKWLAETRINLIHCVPTLFRTLLNSEREPGGFSDLRHILLAGEPLLTSDVKRWYHLYGDRAQLVNLYGPSETTMTKFYYIVKSSDADRNQIPIGLPMDGARAVIIDSAGKACPPGIVGEILIRTPFRSLGYYNRPDLTSDVFIANPLSSDPNDIVYKTGDLARINSEGVFEFIGRADQQVKIRGFRVELGEIEEVLRRHPNVRDVAVITTEESSGDLRLVAYVVEHDPQTEDHPEFRIFLQQYLPNYMIPHDFVQITKLPLLSNGKLDRKALQFISTSKPSQRSYVEPRSDTEAIIASIWREVLGVECVGIHDNFLDIGGHSLLATSIVSQVRKIFQCDLKLRTIFEQPTVAQLAHSVEALMRMQSGLTELPIDIASRDHAVPLSFSQHRLWFLDQFVPNSSAYNIPLGIHLSGPLNIPALELALNEVVRRHEVLRTTFSSIDGEPIQVINAAKPKSLPIINLQDLPFVERNIQVHRLLEKERKHLFDLSNKSLMRVQLLVLDNNEHILTITIHHIVFDGWSANVLMREVHALYQAFNSAQPSPLAPLPIQYADFAVWQRRMFEGDEHIKQLAYWKERLSDLTVLNLPTDRVRPPAQTFQGARTKLNISPETRHALNQLSERHGATLFMTFLAAWKILLARYSGQDDIAVGAPVACRNRADLENLIGFFVNSIVLRTDLSGNPSFIELIQRVRETCLSAYAYQDVPFEQVVQMLVPSRDRSYHPLFQVMIAFQTAPRADWNVEELQISDVDTLFNAHENTMGGVTSVSARFDLTVSAIDTGDTIDGSILWNTDLYEASTIDRMVTHFQGLLEAIVANPERLIWELPLPSISQPEQPLTKPKNASDDRTYGNTLPSLFEAQVGKTPGAIALKFRDQELTYTELNARANQLVWRLRSMGVGLETRVGVCFDRSIEMVVALLGIVKAGGAYVPLSPNYPAERITFMISDAQVGIVLTTKDIAPSLPENASYSIVAIEDNDLMQQWPDENLGINIDPAILAYIIYTSGSTGRPKGSEVPHRAIPGFMFDIDYIDWNARDTFLQHSDISWDALTLELWTPLLLGACCVLYDGIAVSADDLEAAMNRYGITILWLSSAVFNYFVDTAPQILRHARRILVGGESLSVVHVRKALELFPDIALINAYGPSECTCFSCCFQIPRNLSPDLAFVPIGKPIGDRSVRILDAFLQPTPIGAIGEIYIAGPSLARGYANRPDLTALAFIPSPTDVSERIYRTHDLARWLPDGNIEFLGRTDDQVKIRGFRIEIGEIEAALASHELVQQVAVLASATSTGDKRLVAYIVCVDHLSLSELRNYLQRRLPDYMIPSSFVFLDVMPLTASGKVDRRSLPAPESARPDLAVGYIAPEVPSQQILSDIWTTVLGIDNIGIDDNFFELGGHSLNLTQVVSRIRNEFNITLPLLTLFEAPTIRSLSIYIDLFSRVAENSENADANDEYAEGSI